MIASIIGHRKIELSNDLIERVTNTLIYLIENGVNIFLLGSKSEFNALCRDILISLKSKYSNIKMVYIRAEYEFINQDYKNYLLKIYDETYFPIKVRGAGAKSYVIRNRIMIDQSDYVVMYYNKDYIAPARQSKKRVFISSAKSGTELAYEYALSKHKHIINLFKN